MNTATRRVSRAFSTGILAALLAACGGGGGGTPTPPPPVPLAGTAAKGLMANADVSVLPVNADGSIGSPALATGATDAAGHYTLSFAATAGQPYVVQVTARAGGATTHLDEVSGAAQALPAGFTMRALLVPDATGTLATSANVTPFSELAAAAAARASGGITKANADQAISTVKQLLGFDPAGVAVKAAGAAGASENENRQAILLTAVAKLASDGALGCTGGSAGDKVKCVVDTLSAGSSTGSIKLEAGGSDLSAALGGAVGAVLADPVLSGGVTAGTLATVTANLACTNNCAAAPVTTVAAIDSAKALFAQLKTDWTTMFSTGGATAVATGAVNVEAWKFQQAQNEIDVPMSTLLKDLGALITGVDLYNDYRAGRTTEVSRGRARSGDMLDAVKTDTPAAAASFSAVGCTLFTDATTTTEATSPANANVIGCRGSSYVNVVGTVYTDWRHGFTLTPAGGGTFTYSTRTRKRVNNCATTPCTMISNESLQPNAYTGTVTTTTDAGGDIIGFDVSGELAAMLDGKTLVGDHASWHFTGVRTPAAGGGYSDAITGNLVSKDAAGATLGTLTVSQGTLDFVPTRVDTLGRMVKPGSPQDARPGLPEPDSGRFAFTWTVPTAEVAGRIVFDPSVWDKSGYDRMPALVTLAGALHTIEGGVTTEFMSGTLTFAPSGFGNFDNTLSDSATNVYTRLYTFRGTVTAPGRPVLELTASTSDTSFDETVRTASLQYRTLVGGTPRTVVDVTVARTPAGLKDWSFAEAASGLALAWDEPTRTATLRKGSEVIGVYDAATRLMTFSDHSVISLDFGL